MTTSRAEHPSARPASGPTAARRRRARSERGFSLIELAVVSAVIAILTVLAITAFTSLKSRLGQSNFMNELSATMSSARLRAMARQRTVAVIINSTSTSSAFYQVDDLSASQNLASAASVTLLAASFNPAAAGPNYGAGNAADGTAFNLSLQNSQSTDKLAFIRSTAVWGTSTLFPFPFSAVSVDTSNGCTFCDGNGKGAVGFLTDGRTAFSSPGGGALPTSGAIVMGQGTSSQTQLLKKAILIGTSGIVQSISK